MNRRVVITGLGTINPLGHNVSQTWEAIKKGTNGIGFIERINTDKVKMKIAAEVKGFDFEEYIGYKNAKRMDRFSHFAIVAADEALSDSGLDLDAIDKRRMGVYIGSGIGGLETIANECEKGLLKGYHRISPFYVPMVIANIAAGNVAIRHKITGPALASVTACASGANTMGEAFRAIRHGYLDYAIAGGAEATITPFGIAGFDVMHALSKSDDPLNASTPFDLNRSGFVMGEGAGCMILEPLENALARGAKIYGEIIGYGTTCDATHITAPDPLGTGAMECMKQAIEDASINLEEVDHINAHGTSTPLNDKIETLAVKRLFKEHAYNISINSTKSMTGHLLGASGALEGILCVLALIEGFVPPTINYKTPDPECDLDYTVNVGRHRPIKIALSNSLGFGGHNATLVFRKWEGK